MNQDVLFEAPGPNGGAKQYYFLTLVPENDMSEPDDHSHNTNTNNTTADSMSKHTEVTLTLPALPEGWSAEKDFKAIGKISPATQRSIEPVGYVQSEESPLISTFTIGERLGQASHLDKDH